MNSEGQSLVNPAVWIWCSLQWFWRQKARIIKKTLKMTNVFFPTPEKLRCEALFWRRWYRSGAAAVRLILAVRRCRFLLCVLCCQIQVIFNKLLPLSVWFRWAPHLLCLSVHVRSRDSRRSSLGHSSAAFRFNILYLWHAYLYNAGKCIMNRCKHYKNKYFKFILN